MKLLQSMFCIYIVILLLFFPVVLSAQAYDNPESIVYDAANDRYLVSNKGNGDIISVPRTDPTNLSNFSTGTVSSTRGLTIDGKTLWAACTDNNQTDQYLYGFDINTGQVVSASIQFVGGSFVNDVTSDGNGIIYVSDGNVNKIYKVDINTGSFTDMNFSGANGLLYDQANNRLIYTDDTNNNNSQISSIDLATNISTVLITNADFQWLDGLTVDHLGNYYVSSWSTNKIYRYEPNFTSSVLASDSHNGVAHSGAADIFYDQVNNVLAVPNFTANTIDLIPFSQLSAENENDVPLEISLHQNFPNPFNPNTSINYEVKNESFINITIYDLLGAEVVQIVNQIEQPGIKTINWDGRDAKGNLINGGIYVYRLTAGNSTETKKMVLLK